MAVGGQICGRLLMTRRQRSGRRYFCFVVGTYGLEASVQQLASPTEDSRATCFEN